MQDTLPFLSRVKWLQLDHKIIELGRILGKYHLSSLLLRVNCSLERSDAYTGVTMLVSGLGYGSEQMSSGLGSSLVLGTMLNIHDNRCPQVVETPGDKIRMVKTVNSGSRGPCRR